MLPKRLGLFQKAQNEKVHWMEKEIQVSVICCTYNHEKYIREALDSFIMQITDFQFEVLVHDDASTDGTAHIIREYEEKYPELIVPIYQKENQYSKGIRFSKEYIFPRVKGKYIAICEGDDYWIDPYKLQKQYDAMEEHPEVDMCAHSAIKKRNGETVGLIKPREKKCIIKTEDVILGGGGFFATNSLFYRTDMRRNEPGFVKHLSFDYTLQIWGSLRGGVLYLPEEMSVYRLSVDGSWTNRVGKNPTRLAKHLSNVIAMLTILNKETFGRYAKEINQHSAEVWFAMVEVANYSSVLKVQDYYSHFRYLNNKNKIKVIYRFVRHKISRFFKCSR